ncbi:uridine diphosphate-N-acetylglucosamine-binding protein YvcK [Nocardiopsis sp. HUAS JQ3]|uniref:gluconeogenesis factor YvcK family protein n=1 Tax=Nocardiopsis sp. HUAS JQ3 TaxID=3061629 RepID=UPI0023AA0867|nr:uridine diphosphate-N-acetylglucosamine-binding protein YvcK [Nocardiopsis sp. HUAS JQ3]WDZ89182.1 uridine diphosphate-N-acetylglucosamine-binding protein YvcK [Nocardiopsis sp. HUAS JQ3]
MAKSTAPDGDGRRPPRVVALGGGHGLHASLSALRRVTTDVTAVVTVADDGGSSGRLRRELGVLPPGDLRMALAALCGDDEWGHTWSEVIQHRFRSEGELHGHAVGNLLIVALWELLGDSVAGLDWVGQLLGAHGRVLPMSSVPLDIAAEVSGIDPARPEELTTVRGQVACASTSGKVRSISLIPEDPPASPQAVKAVREADWVVFGPGSWFTSVLPHLLVPDLAHALVTTRAKRMVALNLSPQLGETDGFRPETYLEVLREHAPKLGVDVVLADRGTVEEPEPLVRVVGELGGRLELEELSRDDGTPRHDPDRLAAAFERILEG